MKKTTPPTAYLPGSFREVMHIAWPLIVTTGSFTAMLFCDRMFLAWYSSDAIQAAPPAGILAFTLICGFMALAGYAGTFVAQHFGAGDMRGCVKSSAQGIFLALFSWPLLLLLILPGRWLLSVSGHAPEIIALELPYFTILMIGGITSPLNAAAGSFFTGRGKTRVTMVSNIAGNTCNIILDYVLIFGKWGFPEMGIIGAAWATVISGFISPTILLTLQFSRRLNERYQTRRFFLFDGKLMLRMIRFGLPSGVHLALDIASFSVFVLLTGRMGEIALTASNIALSINLVAFLPLVGIGMAASILVGQYQGKGEPQHSARVCLTSVKIGVWYMLAAGSTFILLPELYYSLFSTRQETSVCFEEVLALGKVLMVIMTMWGLADVGNMVLGSALKGAGDTKFVMWYSLIVAWVVLVGGQFVLVIILDQGIIVAWLWTALYVFILSSGYIVRFVRGKWKKMTVLDRG